MPVTRGKKRKHGEASPPSQRQQQEPIDAAPEYMDYIRTTPIFQLIKRHVKGIEAIGPTEQLALYHEMVKMGHLLPDEFMQGVGGPAVPQPGPNVDVEDEGEGEGESGSGSDAGSSSSSDPGYLPVPQPPQLTKKRKLADADLAVPDNGGDVDDDNDDNEEQRRLDREIDVMHRESWGDDDDDDSVEDDDGDRDAAEDVPAEDDDDDDYQDRLLEARVNAFMGKNPDSNEVNKIIEEADNDIEKVRQALGGGRTHGFRGQLAMSVRLPARDSVDTDDSISEGESQAADGWSATDDDDDDDNEDLDAEDTAPAPPVFELHKYQSVARVLNLIIRLRELGVDPFDAEAIRASGLEGDLSQLRRPGEGDRWDGDEGEEDEEADKVAAMVQRLLAIEEGEFLELYNHAELYRLTMQQCGVVTRMPYST